MIQLEKILPWAPEIFQAIKKDLRNEHLLKTPAFVQKYFSKRPLDKLTAEEMAAAYFQEIREGDEELGERVAGKWVAKNAELYHLFATELSKVNPEFHLIESIPSEICSHLLNTSVAQYGATATYLFCVLNSVRLPE